jgi:hypothetical protein
MPKESFDQRTFDLATMSHFGNDRRIGAGWKSWAKSVHWRLECLLWGFDTRIWQS